MKEIAILLTCYNRINVTLNCLENLHSAYLPDGFSFDVYLVDDKSPDNTGQIVKNKYPKINIIIGAGDLYWNRGMHLAWDIASKKKKYDFFLWLNDDTILFEDSLTNILKDYETIGKQSKQFGIITGTCCHPKTNLFSYGGRNDNGPIQPKGYPEKCKYINGNFVLIPSEVYDLIGNLSKIFSHSLGDFDYGLRAQAKGICCWTTSSFIGECSQNPTPKWRDPKVQLNKRIAMLFSPLGLNVREYYMYNKIHFGLKKAILLYALAFARAVSPGIYNFIKNKSK